MLAETRVLDVTSNLGGETIKMGIDPESFAHIQSIMTDMYSDPVLAVIREYSTNALDAHVEAGVKRPIEITLPTSLSPFFKVRDFGTGLGEEEIRTIYSQYGASTKRGTNDAVGMLGIGCKSALTYTDQFSVTSVKDGIKSQISVSRDEDGGGSMTVVDAYETDEEQGTEVSVPMKPRDIWEFEATSTSFFRFWSEGTVLVNGEAPERVDGMWIADDLLINKELDDSYVVMGNVAYPWPNNDFYGFEVVAFVNIGDVNFAPSREALMLTSKTKAKLVELAERVETEKNQAIQKMIENAPDAPSALKVLTKAGSLYSGEASYQGVEIPSQYDVTHQGVRFTVLAGEKVYRRRDDNYVRQVSSSIWPNTVFIQGFGTAEWSAYKRKKLDQWADKQSFERRPSNYVLMPLDIPVEILPWLRKDQIVDWPVIDAEKIKVERSGTPRSDRPKGSYKGYLKSKSQNAVSMDVIEADDIDTSKPVFHVLRDSFASGTNLLSHYNEEFTLILLASNRVNKFERDFPMSKELNAWNKEKREEFLNGLTQDDKLWLVVQNQGQAVTNLKKLEADKLDDPALVQAITLVSQNRDSLRTKAAMFGYTPNGDAPQWSNPLEKYPMLMTDTYYSPLRSATLGGTMKNHLYIYLNAAYAAEGTV